MIRPASSGEAYFVACGDERFLVYTSRAYEPGDEMTFEPKRDAVGRPCWVHGTKHLQVGVAP